MRPPSSASWNKTSSHNRRGRHHRRPGQLTIYELIHITTVPKMRDPAAARVAIAAIGRDTIENPQPSDHPADRDQATGRREISPQPG
jgi:hypothetical protein